MNGRRCSNITQDSVYFTDGFDILMDQFRMLGHQDFRGNKCCKWIGLERKLVILVLQSKHRIRTCLYDC